MDLDVAHAVSAGDVHREFPPGVQAGQQDVVRRQGRPRELVQEDDAGLLYVLSELRIVEHRPALHEAVHPEKSRDGVDHRTHVVDAHLHAEFLAGKAHQLRLSRSGRPGEDFRGLGEDVPDEDVPVGIPHIETVLVNVRDAVALVSTDLVKERLLLRRSRGVCPCEQGRCSFLLCQVLVLVVGIQHLLRGGRQVEIVVRVSIQDGIDVPCAVVRSPGTGRELAHGRAENRPDGIRLTEFHSAGGDLGVQFLDDCRPVGCGLERKRIETVPGSVPHGLEEIVFHCMGVIVPSGLFYLC